MSAKHNVFCDLLKQLGVAHTVDYSRRQFEQMTFKSLFGFTKLLKSYGIDSEGVMISDKEEITKLTAPFLARTLSGFVIVTEITPESVSYLSEGMPETISMAEFQTLWTGMVLLVFPQPHAAEPDYTSHAFASFANRAKYYVLMCGLIALFAYLSVTSGMWHSVWTIMLTALNLAGLFFSWLLVKKTRHVHSSTADRFCRAIEAGGCDHVLSTKASTFLGIVSWSEVGLTYFSVSLLTLLIFPQFTNYLALCNLICLPFSFWSVWYQKFKAKAWCTLCLSVQATLWALFFCYLGGGFIAGLWPLHIQFFVLAITYLTVLLAINHETNTQATATDSNNADSRPTK